MPIFHPSTTEEQTLTFPVSLPFQEGETSIAGFLKIRRWRYHTPPVGMSSIIPGRPGGWCYTMYLGLQEPGDAEEALSLLTSMEGLPWHGGVTYNETEVIDGNIYLVVGCDYQHVGSPANIESLYDLVPEAVKLLEAWNQA